MTQENDNPNGRINSYWEKFGTWACTAMLGFGLLVFQDQRAQVSKLEEKVNFLYQDKVSKADLREEINKILQAQEASKTDIIARMELYFGRLQK
jgi:hypothetical protein